jgi:prepilin-type N-terminal cleavage/methylation domain-containing protein
MIMKRALAKKNGKKGFTLVEVIVVLVILAILAAIAIPALTGYIDKANKRAVLTEARTIGVALQTIASEAYGDGATVKTGPFTATSVLGTNVFDNYKADADYPSTATLAEAISTLTGDATLASLAATVLYDIDFDGNKLTDFKYKGTKYLVTFDEGVYTVS